MKQDIQDAKTNNFNINSSASDTKKAMDPADQSAFDRRKALLIPLNSSGQMLIQDRRGFKKPDWGYFGGEIEAGETPLKAVIRETKEELQIDINPEELKYLGTSITNWSGCKIIRYLYLYHTDQEKFDVLEGRGAHWLEFTKVRELMEDEDRFDEVVKRIEQAERHD